MCDNASIRNKLLKVRSENPLIWLRHARRKAKSVPIRRNNSLNGVTRTRGQLKQTWMSKIKKHMVVGSLTENMTLNIDELRRRFV